MDAPVDIEQGGVETSNGEPISHLTGNRDSGGNSRQSPSSDITADPVEERPQEHIGATRRKSFNNLDEHAGPADPLGESADADNDDDDKSVRLGTVRGMLLRDI